MTDFQRRALTILSQGPCLSEDLGERLFPNGKKGGATHGGPSYVASAAMRQMGKLRRKGWVLKNFDSWRWEITHAGRVALKVDANHGTTTEIAR
jgi:hypothetical protein